MAVRIYAAFGVKRRRGLRFFMGKRISGPFLREWGGKVVKSREFSFVGGLVVESVGFGRRVVGRGHG